MPRNPDEDVDEANEGCDEQRPRFVNTYRLPGLPKGFRIAALSDDSALARTIKYWRDESPMVHALKALHAESPLTKAISGISINAVAFKNLPDSRVSLDPAAFKNPAESFLIKSGLASPGFSASLKAIEGIQASIRNLLPEPAYPRIAGGIQNIIGGFRIDPRGTSITRTPRHYHRSVYEPADVALDVAFDDVIQTRVETRPYVAALPPASPPDRVALILASAPERIGHEFTEARKLLENGHTIAAAQARKTAEFAVKRLQDEESRRKRMPFQQRIEQVIRLERVDAFTGAALHRLREAGNEDLHDENVVIELALAAQAVQWLEDVLFALYCRAC